MRLLKRLYYVFKLTKGGIEMDVIYATLIVRGYKTYDEVPEVIKPKVSEVLRELGAEELITE